MWGWGPSPPGEWREKGGWGSVWRRARWRPGAPGRAGCECGIGAGGGSGCPGGGRSPSPTGSGSVTARDLQGGPGPPPDRLRIGGGGGHHRRERPDRHRLGRGSGWREWIAREVHVRTREREGGGKPDAAPPGGGGPDRLGGVRLDIPRDSGGRPGHPHGEWRIEVELPVQIRSSAGAGLQGTVGDGSGSIPDHHPVRGVRIRDPVTPYGGVVPGDTGGGEPPRSEGRESTRGVRERASSATTFPVRGARRIPLRKCPPAWRTPPSGSGPQHRQPVRGPRRSPAHTSSGPGAPAPEGGYGPGTEARGFPGGSPRGGLPPAPPWPPPGSTGAAGHHVHPRGVEDGAGGPGKGSQGCSSAPATGARGEEGDPPHPGPPPTPPPAPPARRSRSPRCGAALQCTAPPPGGAPAPGPPPRSVTPEARARRPPQGSGRRLSTWWSRRKVGGPPGRVAPRPGTTACAPRPPPGSGPAGSYRVTSRKPGAHPLHRLRGGGDLQRLPRGGGPDRSPPTSRTRPHEVGIEPQAGQRQLQGKAPAPAIPQRGRASPPPPGWHPPPIRRAPAGSRKSPARASSEATVQPMTPPPTTTTSLPLSVSTGPIYPSACLRWTCPRPGPPSPPPPLPQRAVHDDRRPPSASPTPWPSASEDIDVGGHAHHSPTPWCTSRRPGRPTGGRWQGGRGWTTWTTSWRRRRSGTIGGSSTRIPSAWGCASPRWGRSTSSWNTGPGLRRGSTCSPGAPPGHVRLRRREDLRIPMNCGNGSRHSRGFSIPTLAGEGHHRIR